MFEEQETQLCVCVCAQAPTPCWTHSFVLDGSLQEVNQDHTRSQRSSDPPLRESAQNHSHYTHTHVNYLEVLSYMYAFKK